MTETVTNPKIRAAIYARVSTADQNPEPQVAELRNYLQRRGWVLAGEYVDVASGVNRERPQLRRMMADAYRHEFSAVIVWKFDRLARSVSHLLHCVEEFKALHIDFVSIGESVDTTTPAGKMVVTVLGGVAELERSLILERVRLGMAAAKASGKHLGRFSNRMDEKKILADYSALQSMRKVAKLHRCSTFLVFQIVHGHRKVLATRADRGVD
jgi:DNA invertase Pin-like site-specific DNA recombinase